MKKKQSPIGLIIVLLVTAAAILLFKHFYINDLNIIRAGVLLTSDQPKGMDYTRLLYKYHLATIVNVRSHSEHRERNWYNEEIIWVRNNGVNYLELPIKREKYFPDKQTREQFLAIMADKNNLPVLLHGTEDDERVAMLVAVWLRKSQGYSLEKTLKTIKKIIDDRELTNAEIEFVGDLKKDN